MAVVADMRLAERTAAVMPVRDVVMLAEQHAAMQAVRHAVTAVAEPVADSAAAVAMRVAALVAATVAAAAMAVADTGKFCSFPQKGPFASAGGPCVVLNGRISSPPRRSP
jgi:hypothetical protein